MISLEFLKNDRLRFISGHRLKLCACSNSIKGYLKAVIQVFKNFTYQDSTIKIYYLLGGKVPVIGGLVNPVDKIAYILVILANRSNK